MVSGQKVLTQVGSPILGLGLENNSQKDCFGSSQTEPEKKRRPALFYCGSKVCSDWVGSGTISNKDPTTPQN